MSCGACTRRYGFFCKETGCPNCGFSFCTKCLKKEIEVPRHQGSKMKVCPKCFEKLEKEQKNETLQKVAINTDPLLMYEQLDTLAAPLDPITLGEEATPPNEDNEIADNLDSVISKKLSKLKDDDNKVLPDDSEMAARLSALKGVPHRENSKDNMLFANDKRSEQEKINDLLKQFVDENVIDQAVAPVTDPIADIERRLAILKGDSNLQSTGESSSRPKGAIDLPDEPDEEEAIKKTLDRLLDEAKLPEISEEEKEIINNMPPPSKETEELPWCVICNEDAVVRCLGCDNELFCRSCFKDCHDKDEEFEKHETKPFHKPPTFKEDHF